MKSYSKSVVGTGVLLLLSGCGGSGDSGSKSGVAGKVRLGQFGSSSISMMATSKWGDIKASGGNYSWAKVDGLRIQLVSINGSSQGKSETFNKFDSPKTLELGGDTAVIRLNEDISVPEGIYTDAGIRFKNHPQLKAFCRTATKCLYTTLTGVKQVDTAACGDSADLPEDYDYFTVGKMNPDPHFEDEIMEYNKVNYSVLVDQTPYLNILVDTSYAVSCVNSEIPAGNENFDLLHSFITTIVFKNDGEIIAVRSRNFGMGGVDLQQGWSGFEKNGSTYSMLNGEHYEGAKGDYSDARWLEDLKISGLQRSNDFMSRQGIDVINGSDCGKNLNNRTMECLLPGEETKTYWKRIGR